ncbi:hypothetical protein ACFSTD_09220 [Novosphingobium colocasiae]
MGNRDRRYIGLFKKITYWILPFVIAAAFAMLRAAFMARSSELGMERTGRFGISAYMLGFVFLGIALLLDRTFTLPRFVLGILGGAGVWSIAITWLCAAVLINGGWYVKSDRAP